MTKTLSLALSAALLAAAASPALAADTKPVTNPDTASARQATSGQTVNQANGQSQMANGASQNSYQTAANDTASGGSTSNTVGISSDPSPTQRKGTHLSAAQKRKADAEEAETTRQLNQQAAANAAPSGSQVR